MTLRGIWALSQGYKCNAKLTRDVFTVKKASRNLMRRSRVEHTLGSKANNRFRYLRFAFIGLKREDLFLFCPFGLLASLLLRLEHFPLYFRPSQSGCFYSVRTEKASGCLKLEPLLCCCVGECLNFLSASKLSFHLARCSLRYKSGRVNKAFEGT